MCAFWMVCPQLFPLVYLALCWSVTSCRLHWLHPYGKLIGVSGMCLAVNRLFGCMSVRPSFIPSLMHIFGRVLQMTHHVAAPCTNVASVDFTPTVQGPIHIFLFLKLMLKCPFTILLQNLDSTISCATVQRCVFRTLPWTVSYHRILKVSSMESSWSIDWETAKSTIDKSETAPRTTVDELFTVCMWALSYLHD